MTVATAPSGAPTTGAPGLDGLLDRLGGLGFDHVEVELLHGTHASAFVWRSFHRTDGRAFGGRTLAEALEKAVTWAEQAGR